MDYIFNLEDYNLQTVDILIDKINNHYKQLIDAEKAKVIKSNYFVLSTANPHFDNIYFSYMNQMHSVFFYYTDFNSRTEDVKTKLHEYRVNLLDKFKKYKEDSFDELFDHFGQNFKVF
jgi:hypothetical protein